MSSDPTEGNGIHDRTPAAPVQASAEPEPPRAASASAGTDDVAGPLGATTGALTGDLQFIGTATVLVRLGPFTFLTDPNFLHQGEHAKLGYGLRSRRLTEPAMAIGDLPPLDVIVLSHHHGDHFDDIAAAELAKDVPIVTNGHACRKLRRQGFRATIALERWQHHEVRREGVSLRITALPAKHAPQPLRSLLPPVMGSMVELIDPATDRSRFRLYLSGDTLLHDDLEQVPRAFPDIDLAVVHLGGTRILGVLLTMDAEQGVAFLRLIAPAEAIPVHHGDYTVFRSPLEDFRAALAVADLPVRVHELSPGEHHRFHVRG